MKFKIKAQFLKNKKWMWWKCVSYWLSRNLVGQVFPISVSQSVPTVVVPSRMAESHLELLQWSLYSVRWKCLDWMKVSDNRTGRPEILIQYMLPSTELREVNGNARERKKAACHLHRTSVNVTAVPLKKNLLHALHSGQRGNNRTQRLCDHF